MAKAKRRGRGGKATWRHVKNVGMRCVQVLNNGKWRFRSNAACGHKTKR